MRLIDADALIEATKNFCDGYKVHWTDNKVLAWIDHAPTVDAVEVVRCKDCKHWRKKDFQGGNDIYHMEFGGFCPNSRFARYESDFCSYGERRDSDG